MVTKKYLSEYPLLVSEWDHESNHPLTYGEVTHGSNKKVSWVCSDCQHRWEAVVASRAKGRGCPVCRGRKVVPGVNDLASLNPPLAREWDTRANSPLTPELVSAHSGFRASWVCGVCSYIWVSIVSSRTKGEGCPSCSGRVVRVGVSDLATTEIRLSQEWDYTKNFPLTPNEVSRSSGKRVWWICSDCSHSWDSFVYNRTKSPGCPGCNLNRSQIEIEVCAALGAKNNVTLPSRWVSGHYHRVDGLLDDKTVVEYDGSHWHRDKIAKDVEKTHALLKLGYTVVRIREHPLPFLPSQHGLVQLTHVYGQDSAVETAEKVRLLVS